MTFGKATALAFGFAGAMALGIWVGPHITHRAAGAMNDQSPYVQQAPETPPATPPPTATAQPHSRPTAVRRTPVFAPTGSTVATTAPALHERIRPLLKQGANMEIAAEGFRSAEEFAAVAHASRNLDVPFLLLKHRVLDENKSLAEAIRESKPDIDAGVEADRARAEARSDLVSLAS